MDGREILKEMARQAKNRLQGKTTKRLKINGCNVTSINDGKTIIKTINKSTDIENKFYNKVKNCVDNNIVNPLSELIDFNYYKTLNNEQKERYFFLMAEKYKRLKNQYENEKLKEVY